MYVVRPGVCPTSKRHRDKQTTDDVVDFFLAKYLKNHRSCGTSGIFEL